MVFVFCSKVMTESSGNYEKVHGVFKEQKFVCYFISKKKDALFMKRNSPSEGTTGILMNTTVFEKQSSNFVFKSGFKQAGIKQITSLKNYKTNRNFF